MYLIDLQFWSKIGVDLFQQVYGSAGNVITSLDYHLGESRIWKKGYKEKGSSTHSRAETLTFKHTCLLRSKAPRLRGTYH